MSRFREVPAKDWTVIDRKLNLPSDDRIRKIAADWNDRKAANQHRQPIVEDHRLVGLLGERAFARTFRLPMDLRKLTYGNRRRNFTLKNGAKVDVVTRRPIHGYGQPELAVPMDTRGRVDFWVLCVWLGDGFEPDFSGFIPEEEATKRGRIVQFHERGVPNIVVRGEWLAPIEGLLWMHRPTHPDAVKVERSWWEERAAELELLAEVDRTRDPPKKGPEPPPDDDQLTLW